MQGLGIHFPDLLMAHHAGPQIIRGPFYQILVGGFPIEFFGVSFMAQDAAHLQMRIFIQKLLINDISFIHVFRPNWRRRPGSPFAFACGHGWWFMQGLHQRIAGMAHDAAVRVSGKRH
jgi:hypothetical protein